MGQPRKDFALTEERLTSEEISEGRRENVQNPALAEWHKILIPPLHIKFGLMKNFVKAMDRSGSAFKYLTEEFPRLSEATIKMGVFVGPQIHKLFRDDMLNNLLQGDERKSLGRVLSGVI